MFESRIALILGIAPNEVGIDPDKLLNEKSRRVNDCRFARKKGIGPAILFLPRFKVIRGAKLNVEGMLPDKRFWERSRICRFVNALIWPGIIDDSMLLLRSKD